MKTKWVSGMIPKSLQTGSTLVGWPSLAVPAKGNYRLSPTRLCSGEGAHKRDACGYEPPRACAREKEPTGGTLVATNLSPLYSRERGRGEGIISIEPRPVFLPRS